MSGSAPPSSSRMASKAAGLGKEGLRLLKSMHKMIEEDRSSYTVSKFNADFTSYASINEQRMKSIEASIRSISAAGLTFAKGGKVNVAVNTVSTMMDKLAGNASLGSKAVEALAKNMELFPQMAERSQQFAEKLGLQAASLDRLGISFQTYTKNVEIAQNMFQMSQKEVLGLNEGLKQLADDLKMLPSTVSTNFQLVAKSLSYEGPKVAEQFKKMQMLSQQTGVSVGSLMSGFGDRLDTMSGAAQFVGQLNAILGTNAFSPNEILMMDESERMIKIRETIRAHPIYDDIMAGGKLGKFALNTMSKVIGYSKEDTRKYLTGNLSQSTVDAVGGKGITAAKKGGREAASAKSQLNQQLSDLPAQLGTKLTDAITKGLTDEKFMETIRKRTQEMQKLYLSPQDQAMVGERGRVIGVAGRAAGGDFLKDQGDIFSQFARRPGDDKLRDLANAMLSGQAVQQTGRFGMKGLNAIVETLGMTGPGNKTKTDRMNKTYRAISRVPEIVRVLEALQTLPVSEASDPLRKKLGGIISKIGTGDVSQKEIDDALKSFEEVLGPKNFLAQAFRQSDGIVDFKEAQMIAMARKFVGEDNLGAYRTMIRIARDDGNSEGTFEERLEEALIKEIGGDKIGGVSADASLIDKIRAEASATPEEVEKLMKASNQAGMTPSRAPAGRQSGPTSPFGSSTPATPTSPLQGMSFDQILNYLINMDKLTFLFKLPNDAVVPITNAAFKREGAKD